MKNFAPTIAFTALAGMAALAAGAGMYRLSAGKEIDELVRDTYSSPAMEKTRALTQTRKRLESCVFPEGTYNAPATSWDHKTEECLRDAKEYDLFGGDIDKLKNADAVNELLKSHNEYWIVFGDVDPFVDPFTGKTGVAPYTTQKHMDSAIDIMKRRDWLTNSDLTGRVFGLMEESYDEYAKCGVDIISGEPRNQRCRDDAAQVRKNYIRLNRETAAAAHSTRIPLDVLNRLEGK